MWCLFCTSEILMGVVLCAVEYLNECWIFIAIIEWHCLVEGNLTSILLIMWSFSISTIFMSIIFYSRLLSLAACFATKMVRKYGLGQPMQDEQCSLPKHYSIEVSNARRLSEMAHFLEVIRNIRSRLSTKGRRPGQGVVWNGSFLNCKSELQLEILTSCFADSRWQRDI